MAVSNTEPLLGEWAKALISAVVGFAVAMIAEPLKAELIERRAIRKLRRALYIEMAENFSRARLLQQVMGKAVVEMQNLQHLLRNDVYAHSKLQPALFYQLKDAAAIERFCIALQLLKDTVQPRDVESRAQGTVNMLSMAVSTGEINGKLLVKSAQEYFRPQVQDLLSHEWEGTDDPQVKMRIK
jgi:hypothetical protein